MLGLWVVDINWFWWLWLIMRLAPCCDWLFMRFVCLLCPLVVCCEF